MMSRSDADLEFIFAHLTRRMVSHKRLNKRREWLIERVWWQRSLLKRRGFVGEDWEALLKDLEEFAFIEQSMADEIERRRLARAKPEAETKEKDAA